MKRSSPLNTIVAALLALILFQCAASAQVFSVLKTFTPDGAAPLSPPIQSADGTLYGVALYSYGYIQYGYGEFTGSGAVYKVRPDGTQFSVLYFFSETDPDTGTNTDGAYPQGGLVLVSNTLFGSTTGGGPSGSGTIFSINTNGANFTVLHSFSSATNTAQTNTDGASPAAALTLGGNVLYGTARAGGANGNGTLFSLTTNGSAFTVLHTFSSTTNTFETNNDGAYPSAPLILSAGALYGTASKGGNGSGVVFSIATNGSAFTILHNFTALNTNTGTNTDGSYPQAGLLLAGGRLYGAATDGGWNQSSSYSNSLDQPVGNGALYSVQTNGTGFTNFHNFTGTNDGAFPQSTLVLSNGTLFGTEVLGVFSIKTNGSSATNFLQVGVNTDVSQGLVLSAGKLYGGLIEGGEFGFGSVFSVSTNGASPANIHSFYVSYGEHPQSGVTLSGSTVYGTTDGDDDMDCGSIFSMNANGGNFSSLLNFTPGANQFNTNTYGSYPAAGVTIGGTRLYGACLFGGGGGIGTLYSLDTNGSTLALLHTFSFTNTGGYEPYGSMVVAGNRLYGTAFYGGAGFGTIFSMATNGTGYTNLYSFTNGTDGALPNAPMMLSSNTLYGTTQRTNGTIYAISTNGSGFKVLYTFPGTNEQAFPSPGVIYSGSTLYGTTYGTTGSYGSVFAFNTATSNFTTLYKFTGGTDGANPVTGLVLSGSTLYGDTKYGGIFGNGAVFSINTNGSGFISWHNFSAVDSQGTNSDGVNPLGSLVVSSNDLIGTANEGGQWGLGTVFQVKLGAPGIIAQSQTQTNQCGSNVTLSVIADGVLGYQWRVDETALSDNATTSGSTTAVLHLTATMSQSGSYTVVVSNTYGAVTSSIIVLSVQDTLPPVITLNGPASTNLPPSGSFSDPGATATDLCAGTLTVTTSGSVNVHSPGTYHLTYTAMDPSGNSATNTRTVVVVAPLPVQITAESALAGNSLFGMSFNTSNGQSYSIQQSTNLATTHWRAYSNFTGNGSLFQLATPASNRQQYFRVSEP